MPHELLPIVLKRLKKLARKKSAKTEKPKAFLSGLQKQILKLKEESFTDEEVAEQVHCSPDAVKKRLGRLYVKFHVRHRIGALL
jgi:DNA-binding NarL/FixJ family response regulator